MPQSKRKGRQQPLALEAMDTMQLQEIAVEEAEEVEVPVEETLSIKRERAAVQVALRLDWKKADGQAQTHTRDIVLLQAWVFHQKTTSRIPLMATSLLYEATPTLPKPSSTQWILPPSCWITADLRRKSPASC